MSHRLTIPEQISLARPLGREDVFISDEVSRSVLLLEFVFRCEDISVWHGRRTLAVMDRHCFARWLRTGTEFVIDDLAWTVQGRPAYLTIDGHRTYALDAATIATLAAIA